MKPRKSWRGIEERKVESLFGKDEKSYRLGIRRSVPLSKPNCNIDYSKTIIIIKSTKNGGANESNS